MIIRILDNNFKIVHILEQYLSFIWNDRYNTVGDCQFEVLYNKDNLEILKVGYYINNSESEKEMIIECVKTQFKDNGLKTLLIECSSLESILNRRIIWGELKYKKKDKVYNIIKDIIDKNIINTLEKRKLPIEFIESSDEQLLSYEIKEDVEMHGDNVLDIIEDYCSSFNIGYKLIRNKENNTFNFSLYIGEDRSFDQTKNIPIIFSYFYDNLLSSSYYEDNKAYKNVAGIFKKDSSSSEDEKYIIEEYYRDEIPVSGLDRKEVKIDMSSNTDEKKSESEMKFEAIKDFNKNYKLNKIFDGEIETQISKWLINKDYYLGDIVQFEDEIGHTDKSRIMEVIYSMEVSGLKIYPTLRSMREEEKEDG